MAKIESSNTFRRGELVKRADNVFVVPVTSKPEMSHGDAPLLQHGDFAVILGPGQWYKSPSSGHEWWLVKVLTRFGVGWTHDYMLEKL